ncbi:MAG: zinc ribbon domain-containing protein [Oscillospiraceae bacterium]|nr:zinc ribbon domain-containing protein [Oscillospiraceae bacterium]
MEKQFCQSCGMPMSKEEEFGTNADGTLNRDNCGYCFKNGEYTNPNITMNEMLAIGLRGIDENPEMNKFMKFIIKKMYPSQLKNLKRWKA